MQWYVRSTSVRCDCASCSCIVLRSAYKNKERSAPGRCGTPLFFLISFCFSFASSSSLLFFDNIATCWLYGMWSECFFGAYTLLNWIGSVRLMASQLLLHCCSLHQGFIMHLKVLQLERTCSSLSVIAYYVREKGRPRIYSTETNFSDEMISVNIIAGAKFLIVSRH